MDTVKKLIGRHLSDEYMEKELWRKYNLGCDKYDQKRYDQAERYFRFVVQESERVYEADHDITIESKYRLGRTVHFQRKYDEAEKLLRQAAQAQERSLGPGHKDTIYSQYWLGITLFRQRKYSEAENLLRELVLVGGRSLEPNHEIILEGQYRLGSVLSRQGKHIEAENLLRQVVRVWEESLEPIHEDIVLGNYWLARALFDQGKYNEAENQLRKLIQVGERSLEPNDTIILQAKYWLARALSCQGKYSEAENLLRQVVRIWKKSFGPNHEETLCGQYWLGCTLSGQGKFYEAEKIFRWIMQGKGKTDHKFMHKAKYQLARIYFEQGKHVESEDLLRQVPRSSRRPSGLDDNEFQEFQESLDRKGEAMRISRNDLSDTFQRMGWRDAVDDGHEEALESLASPRESHQEVRPLSPTVATTKQAQKSRLESYFPPGRQDTILYSDSTIREIQVLLGRIDIKWSRVPRIYIILRITGYLNLLDSLIDVGFSDYWLPVTEQGLPDCLQPSARAKFVRAQKLILTKSLDLERGQNGQHCYFEQGESLPFDYQGRLGSGGFGQVDKIISHTSFKEYALKRVRRNIAFGGRQRSAIMQFIGEIEILKRLKHQHVAEYVGSYTDTKHIGLVMSPVADMNLMDYIGCVSTSNCRELRTFFGCLARALEFLHAENIRHKDIKPNNILVNHGNVLFTDFGLSLDFGDADGSTTTGIPNGMSPRYCAPEVAERDSRNTKSDIWSLGVVFMEMTVVLKGKSIQDMDGFFEGHGSERKYIRTNLAAFKEFTAELEDIGELSDNKALHWAAQMLVVEQRERPTASELVTSITSPGEEGEASQFCGICCVSAEEDEFSDFSD
ncbi:hypothetical protein SLS60_008472 [Paraconiothyrium brasiliense]|uniref:Protein kinase domain-containing protein n=1 Tax=Paraconiothyrium brasiliense TaxID=300254 RepID=A0ABR3R0P6_9PLEO